MGEQCFCSNVTFHYTILRLGGSPPEPRGDSEYPTISLGPSSESEQVLPLIPKILELFGHLSDTITQPGVEEYLTNGMSNYRCINIVLYFPL